MWIGPENIFSDMRSAYPDSGLKQVKDKIQAFGFSAKELLYMFKGISENLVQALDAIDGLVKLDLDTDSAQEDANQYVDDLNRNLFQASIKLEKAKHRLPDEKNGEAYNTLIKAYNAVFDFATSLIRNGLDDQDHQRINEMYKQQAFFDYHAKNVLEQPPQPSIILKDPSTGQRVQGDDPQWQKNFQQIWDIIKSKVPRDVMDDMSFTVFQKTFFDLVPKIQEKGFGLMGAAKYLAFGRNILDTSGPASGFRFISSRNPELEPSQIQDFITRELPILLEQEMSDFYQQRILPYIIDEIKEHPELEGIALMDGEYKDMWEQGARYQVAPLCADPWTGISKSTRLNQQEIPQEIGNKLFAPPEGINLTGEMKEIIYGEVFPELAAKGIGIPDSLKVAVTFRFEAGEVKADDFQFELAFNQKPDLPDERIRKIEEEYIQKEVRNRLETRLREVCERTITPRLGQLTSRAQELFKGLRYRAEFRKPAP